MAILVIGTAVLAAGVALPALMGDGADRYEGEDRAFAEFVLVYDQELKEWPFPVDPTVSSRVEDVRVRPGDHRGCTTAGAPERGPYFTGHFSGDYSAEVVHYGPFFVPSGKNFFRCDLARTVPYPEFAPDGPLFAAWGLAVLLWTALVLPAMPVVPGFLLVGGVLLWRRSDERFTRAVGLAGIVEGISLLTAAVWYYGYPYYAY
jgi:hypothetical protein